jgi:hypothetical protein
LAYLSRPISVFSLSNSFNCFGGLRGICTPTNCTELGGLSYPVYPPIWLTASQGILGFVSFSEQRLINWRTTPNHCFACGIVMVLTVDLLLFTLLSLTCYCYPVKLQVVIIYVRPKDKQRL